jgi:hypothetical protein
MVVAKIQKLFAGKLGVVVCDDGVGNPRAVDDVGEQ